MMLTEEGTVPDGGYGWVVVFAAFVLNFIVVGMARSFGIIYVLLLEMFNENATTTIWVQCLYNALRMLLAPVSSILCSRFTARKVVLFGSVLMSIGVVSSGFSTNIYVMFVSYGVVAGIGSAFLYAPSLIVITNYFEKKKGKAMSISTSGGGIGTIVLPLFYITVIDYYGFRGGMLIIGAVVLNCAFAGALLRPAEKLQVNKVKDDIKIGYDKNKDHQSKQQQSSIYVITATSESCKSNIFPRNKEIVEKDKSSSLNSGEGITCDNSGSSSDENNLTEGKRQPPPLFKNVSFLIYCGMIMTMPLCILGVYLIIADYTKEKGVAGVSHGNC